MRKHFKRAVAFLLMPIMVFSTMSFPGFAVEEGDPAIAINGLPGDESYGVIYNVEGYVMGFALHNGQASVKPVTVSADGRRIGSLPAGSAIIRFIRADAESDYYLSVGGKYLTCKNLDEDRLEQLVLTDQTEYGSRWRFVADRAGAADCYNIQNVEYGQDEAGDVYLRLFQGTALAAGGYHPESAELPASAFQMKFFSSSEDEDGCVGEIPRMNALPVEGEQCVIYSPVGRAVISQPSEDNASLQSAPAALTETENDDFICYEDICDGGLIFTVSRIQEGGVSYYRFETGGKYLAASENSNTGTDAVPQWSSKGHLLLLSAGELENRDPENVKLKEYTKWELSEGNDGWNMRNKAAKWQGKTAVFLEYYDARFRSYSLDPTRQAHYTMRFYHVADQDGQGYAANPTLRIDDPDPRIGTDCPVSFSINDVSTPESVLAYYQVDDCAPVCVAPEMLLKRGSFTVPAAALEGGQRLRLTVCAQNTIPKSYSASLEAEILDDPLILSVTPAADSRTGMEKRPEIAVVFSNVGANPVFQMQLDDETVHADASANKLSCVPDRDLVSGAHSVCVTITRADGKSVSRHWCFWIGEGGERLYFGQIHAHTAAYSDGTGTLEEAYTHAQSVDDMDFLIVTDHSDYFDTPATATTSSYYDLRSLLPNADGSATRWEEARAIAQEYNERYDDFICAYGYEMSWSGGPGHISSFNTYGVVSRNNRALNNKSANAGMYLYNDMMVRAELGLAIDDSEAQSTRSGVLCTGVSATKYLPFDEDGGSVPVVSQFNHPGQAYGNFDSFAGYTPQRDDVLNLIEVGCGEGQVGSDAYFPAYEQYEFCLSKGWHVGPTNNQDNHKGAWGDANSCRTVILTDDFSEIGLYRALSARRVYATEDQNLRIYYELEAAGQRFRLGDIAPFSEDAQPESITIHLRIQDPDHGDTISTVELIGEGGKILRQLTLNATECEEQIVLANTDAYYYVRVVEADGNIAVTAPIWMKEALPVSAELKSSAYVAVQGEEEAITVTLHNNSSAEAVTLRGSKLVAEGRVLADMTGMETVVAPGSFEALTIPFTPSKTRPSARKTYNITASFTLDYRGQTLNLSKTIAESSCPPEMVTYIALDRAHDNLSISDDSAGDDSSFPALCARHDIVCQYLEKGQINTKNLSKYQAVLITVPCLGESAKPTAWTASELKALADYAAKGGTILNFSKSERFDYVELVNGKDSYAYSSAAMSNAINKAVGAQTRFVRGIAVDNKKKADEAFRIRFDAQGLLGDHPITDNLRSESGSSFEWYDGTGVTSDPCLRFHDVKRNAWYHAAVDFVLDYGLMSGTSPTSFAPDTELSREMFVTILWRIAGSPASRVKNPFRDVKKSNWSYRAILWAYEVGITSGKTHDSFDRISPVSREELAVFLYSYARYQGMKLRAPASLSAFADRKSISKYAKTAMNWAVANQLISGSADGNTRKLNPKSSTTRAMGATILKAFVAFSGEALPRADTAVTTLLSPCDSTWISAYRNYFTGKDFVPKYDTAHVRAKKGSFALITIEKLAGGGWLLCAGAAFLSDLPLQDDVPADEQSASCQMICGILDFIRDLPRGIR